MIRSYLRSLVAAAALTLAVSAAYAVDADILGVVNDESGGTLPGVTITARNPDTGLTRSVVSDGQGRYRIVALPVGRYEITAVLGGFQTVVRTGITLSINMRANVNFLMKLAKVQETLTVSGEAPMVETTSSEVGVTFHRRLIDVMPSNGRNPTDLLLLAPGVSPGVARGGYAISGSLERNNSYTIDGIDNNDDIVGGRRVDLQQDVVREFQLITNQFTSEYGRASGGSVNILTESGTNEFRGRLNFFWRNDDFDAQPYLSKKAGVEKSPFDRKTFGGNLGGRVIRDKTHFFAAYEQEKETENLEFDLLNINYPAVGRYPAIQGGFHVDSRTTTNPKYFGKLTHQFAPAHLLAFTFNHDRNTDPQQDCNGTDLTCIRFTGKDYFFVANYNWVISPRTLNVVRLARTWYDYLWVVPVEQRFPLHDRPGIDYGQQGNMPQGRDERHWILSSTLSHTFNWLGDHDLRLGAEVNLERSASFFDSNFGGTFLFNTDRPFDASDRSTYPTRYTVRTGDSTVDRDMNVYAAFLQDSWRITPNFTLNLGLRYDLEIMAKHLRDTGQQGLFNNIPLLSGDTNYKTDTDNFGPRLGFAWDPWKDGKTSVRGGFGLYYDQVFLNVQGNVYRFGVVPRTVDARIDNPCYPDPSVTIPGLCGESIAPGAPTRSPTVASGRVRSPYALNTSLGFVRQILPDLAASIDFVRLRTYNWPINYDLNPRCTLTGTLEGDCAGPIGSNASRPDSRWLSLNHIATDGDKLYRGVQVSVNKRMAKNYQFRISYTLSKTEDNAGDFTSNPQSYFHPEREKALSLEHQRHRVVVSGIVRLPLDIHVSGVVTYGSGRPFNIRMGTDWNGNGNPAQDRPDSRPTRDNIDQGTVNNRPYYPQGPADRGADGRLPRNSGEGPDYFSIDARISRPFPFFGKRSVELIVEGFNLTNRVNERAYNGNVRSDQYYLRRQMRGEIGGTQTFDPFQAQVGFRLNF